MLGIEAPHIFVPDEQRIQLASKGDAKLCDGMITICLVSLLFQHTDCPPSSLSAEAADPGAVSSGPRLSAVLHQSVAREREGQLRRSERVTDLQCILRESWSLLSFD